METFVLAFLAVAGLAVSSVVTSIWGGFVLTKLWIWFIVPVFHLPVLTLVPAIGLCFVASYLTHQYQQDSNDQSTGQKIGGVVAYGLMYPSIVLFMGWIVQMFM